MTTECLFNQVYPWFVTFSESNRIELEGHHQRGYDHLPEPPVTISTKLWNKAATPTPTTTWESTAPKSYSSPDLLSNLGRCQRAGKLGHQLLHQAKGLLRQHRQGQHAALHHACKEGSQRLRERILCPQQPRG